jgi:hypothetical protein
MGVLEMPAFILGRRSRPLHIWYRHCQSQGSAPITISGALVEPITGIPHSLLDLFSRIDMGATEEDFRGWSGQVGTFAQSHLWEAYRYPGILAVRRLGRIPSETMTTCADENISSCPEAIAVNRIVSSIDAVYSVNSAGPSNDGQVPHNIVYPLFVAGSQVRVMNQHSDWKQAIKSFLSRLIKSEEYCQTEKIFDLLQKAWDHWAAGHPFDISEKAAEQGLELALF